VAVLALDLGGTKLAAALVSATGELRCREATPLAGRTGPAVGALIRARVADLLSAASAGGDPVVALGASVPGIARAARGTVWAPNIGGWEDYPLRDELRAAVGRGVAVSIDSDRACSILGEAWLGAARGCRDAIFLAVGTGIGAGILCDGRVLRGRSDIAGAIGWLALDRPFRPEYGPLGCFEYHASGEGLARVARDLLAESKEYQGPLRLPDVAALTAHDVFAAYEAGDALAERVIENAIGLWGMAVANLVSLFNPERVILGGGVFGPAVRFIARIREEARRWAQPISIEEVVVEPSRLGPDAALYGAARLALQAAGGSPS
jgi:glucokinase